MPNLFPMACSLPSLSSTRVRRAAAVVALALVGTVVPLAQPAAAADPYDSVIDITFPSVPGEVTFGDWYDAGRSGGRAHKATDIMGPKLTPVFAAMGGEVVRIGFNTSMSGNYITIAGDDGRTYSYVHLNNDSPGTDDGLAPREQAFAPGLEVGAEVTRGQHIGWIGDSGNAEGTPSHVHFSIADPHITDPYGTDKRDPYPSLLAAIEQGDVSDEFVHPLPAPPPPPPTGPVPDLSAVCGAVSPQSFADVPDSNTHVTAIECLAGLDVALGFTDGRYGPSGTVTRLQMASFVARLLEAGGVTLPEPTGDHFDDDNGSEHERAVNQLVEIGVIQYDTGENRAERDFEGEIAMKRDRMAAWVARAYELIAGQALPATSTDYFRDDARYHEADINRLAAAGIVQGTAPGVYDPRASVRRDQMASYLARTLAAADAA